MGYKMAMHSDAILAAVEEVSHLVGVLDARISASPLAEAWQVRACFLAAENLAAVDGTPTRPADILGLMSGTALPHPDNYLPALAGYGHWRRCLAQVELSDLASRLVGRTLSTKAAAAEQQADWDLEDTLPVEGRRSMGTGTAGDVDEYARKVGERALRLMRKSNAEGPKLVALARGMQDAIRVDPDPDYFTRAHEIRKDVKAQAKARGEWLKGALPSPDDDEQEALIDGKVDEFLDGLDWEKPSHLGSCYAVLPDRLQDLGLSQNRLSCLTGATKRLGFEGRLDERALRGFLNQLAHEAKAGLALLDSLELLLAEFAVSPAAGFDARSQLPEIIYAFLLYPAVDTIWLETALDLQDRVVRKFVKRLSDGMLIAHWAERRSRDDSSGRDVRLWTAARFENDFQLAMRRPASSRRPSPARSLTPAAMINRSRSVDTSKPMSAVFEKFDQDMIDLEEEFGRFFGSRLAKIASREGPLRAKSGRPVGQST